jgi:hypothetical protein
MGNKWEKKVENSRKRGITKISGATARVTVSCLKKKFKSENFRAVQSYKVITI